MTPRDVTGVHDLLAADFDIHDPTQIAIHAGASPLASAWLVEDPTYGKYGGAILVRSVSLPGTIPRRAPVRVAQVRAVGVRADRRGLGIGTALIRTAAAAYTSRGFRLMFAMIAAPRTDLIELYHHRWKWTVRETPDGRRRPERTAVAHRRDATTQGRPPGPDGGCHDRIRRHPAPCLHS